MSRSHQAAVGDPAASADAGAVQQLVLRERQSRDRGWWEEMAGCFTPEATIDMSWFTGSAHEFVERTRRRSTDGVWGRHRLSAPTVRVDGDRAWVELPLGIEFPVTVGDVPGNLVSYCRSQYRARRNLNGFWRIMRITAIYERDELTAAIPGTQLPVSPDELRGYRASFRCLAWYFAQDGIGVADDTLGDDRPEAVAAHYAAEGAWLAEVDG